MLTIGTFYIERSSNFAPCWDIANSKKEAIKKAKKWSITDKCLCSITKGNKKILFVDYTGQVYNRINKCLI
ncbi:MAG: hypothetical protein GYA02_17155 [Clostridiaceae bacterium]|nr:hypothetical protein [Clostridiaceae bacterium]